MNQFLITLTLDLWLNFDSSICTSTPGPPSLGIGCNNSDRHAISRQRRANFTSAFIFAIPSLSITVNESFWDHFHKKCVCRWMESLLPAKNESSLIDFLTLQWLHFLKGGTEKTGKWDVHKWTNWLWELCRKVGTEDLINFGCFAVEHWDLSNKRKLFAF